MRNVARALPAVVATELVALYSPGNWAQLVTAATRSAALPVGELPKAQKLSLQANNTTNDRGDHPGRDAQFSHIDQKLRWRLAGAGDSFDAKKKRFVGLQKTPVGNGIRKTKRNRCIDASAPSGAGKETENRSREPTKRIRTSPARTASRYP